MIVRSIFLSRWVFILLVVFSCQPKSQNSLPLDLDRTETLRVYIGQEPVTLDWNKSSDVISSTINNNLMAGLVNFDLSSETVRLVPSLARSWKSKKSGLQWVFSLREDVLWSDGMPFKGQQIIDGWKRLLNPKTAAPSSYKLFSIVGAKGYSEGKISFDKVGLKLLDDYTIEVTLARPTSYFPKTLIGVHSYPIRKDLIVKYGDRWIDPGSLVTLGPYKLLISKDRSYTWLEKNEKYFDRDKIVIKNILFYWLDNKETAIRLFRSRKLDLVKDIPPHLVEGFKSRGELKSTKGVGVYFLGLRVDKEPFLQKSLRKAVALAIDRSEVKSLFKGNIEVLKSFVPQGILGHAPSVGLDFNPDLAKNILAESGLDSLNIQMGYNTDPVNKMISENIQAQLKKNLNLKIQLSNEGWKSYMSKLNQGFFSIYRLSWTSDYPDPDGYLSIYTSDSQNNRTGWKNKEYDQIILKASGELNVKKRGDLYSQAQKILLEDEIVVIPLFVKNNNYLVHKRVFGFSVNRMERLNFSKVRLSK